MPRVTVISVTYNNLDDLIRTRNSVLSQQYEGEIEHVIVDGSVNPLVIEYINEQISEVKTKLISEPDSGIYDAMNKGIKVATGDVLWWLNSGDIFSDSASISNAIKVLPIPRESWGFGITEFVTQKGEFSGISFPYPFHLNNQLLGYSFTPHPSSFFGVDLVNKVGGYDVSIKVAADQVFISRISQLSIPFYCPRVLATFESGGISSSLSPRQAISQVRKGLKNAGASTPSITRRLSLSLMYHTRNALRKIAVFARK